MGQQLAVGGKCAYTKLPASSSGSEFIFCQSVKLTENLFLDIISLFLAHSEYVSIPWKQISSRNVANKNCKTKSACTANVFCPKPHTRIRNPKQPWALLGRGRLSMTAFMSAMRKSTEGRRPCGHVFSPPAPQSGKVLLVGQPVVRPTLHLDTPPPGRTDGQ